MKIIFGAVYLKKGYVRRNDQHYYYYIPVAYEDKGTIRYKMVDTYMVQNPYYGNTDYAKKIWFLEQANCGETSYKIFNDHFEYFYQNYYDISSLELNDDEWEMVADLHNYKIVSDDEARDYLPGDLIKYLPLWREDSYRSGSGVCGSCFVKKDAQKDGWNIYTKCLNDNTFRFEYDWGLTTLERTCKVVLAKMKLGYGKKKEIKNTLKKIRKYRKLSKEYDKFCKNLK